MRRISLCQLQHSFRFIRDNQGKWARIPRRVGREIQSIRDTRGLLVADVGAPLGGVVWCGDAEGGEQPNGPKGSQGPEGPRDP